MTWSDAVLGQVDLVDLARLGHDLLDLGVEFRCVLVFDVRGLGQRVETVDFELQTRLDKRILVDAVALGHRGQRLVGKQAVEQVGDQLRVGLELGPAPGRQAQQFGLVVGAGQLRILVFGQHVVGRVRGGGGAAAGAASGQDNGERRRGSASSAKAKRFMKPRSGMGL